LIQLLQNLHWIAWGAWKWLAEFCQAFQIFFTWRDPPFPDSLDIFARCLSRALQKVISLGGLLSISLHRYSAPFLETMSKQSDTSAGTARAAPILAHGSSD
jgi:hypothetical protein